MKHEAQVCRPVRSGFTLTELLIASSISLIVLGVAMGVFLNVMRSWHWVELRMQADRDVNLAMSHMVYGMGDRRGLRSASGVTYTAAGDGGWTLAYKTGGTSPQNNTFTYSVATSNLVLNPGSLVAGRGISYAPLSFVGQMSLIVTLRVDRVDGVLKARREIGSEISFRNL